VSRGDGFGNSASAARIARRTAMARLAGAAAGVAIGIGRGTDIAIIADSGVRQRRVASLRRGRWANRLFARASGSRASPVCGRCPPGRMVGQALLRARAFTGYSASPSRQVRAEYAILA
jgi:hypothetical protein